METICPVDDNILSVVFGCFLQSYMVVLVVMLKRIMIHGSPADACAS